MAEMASQTAGSAARRPGLDRRTLVRLLVALGLAALVAALVIAVRTGAIGRGNVIYNVLVDPFVLMVDMPDLLVQTLWEGLVSGVLYALIALGFVLIFKASGVFNFAQGIMVVFAALTLVGLTEKGVPALLALVLTIGVMFLLAVAIERVVLRPLVNQPDIILFMATFGLTYVQIGLGELIFGGNPKQMIADQLFLPRGSTDVSMLGGRVSFQHIDIAAAVIASAMIAALSVFFSKTRIGRALRAVADSHKAALSVGISLNQIWVIVWFTAGIVALVTGIMWGARSDVSFALEVIALKADRKSTRLNSSHANISYAVFCLKKNKFIQFHCIIASDIIHNIITIV